MRIVRNLTSFLTGMLLAAALFLMLAPHARSEDAPIDLPKELPTTSTLFYTCEHGKPEIIALIVTFKNGTVIRLDAQHMHGIPNAKYVAEYGDMATDKMMYGAGDCGSTKT